MNQSGSETPGTPGRSAKRALKANKACVPCRARKTKCDAAVTGLPCSSCTSRECVRDCVLPVRKGRTRKINHESLTPNQVRQSIQLTSGDALDHGDSHSTESDLFYLNILKEAGEQTTESNQQQPTSNTLYHPNSNESLTPRNCQWTKLPHLDDSDNEYLAKKGVFDLPPSFQLDKLIKSYFDHVHPFAPVINRVDFIRSYESATDVLSAWGFGSRSLAQTSLFSKVKVLHDFAAEKDPLVMLQASIVLCMVILDYPTDRDFGYWFHNAIRLATKLDIRSACIRGNKPSAILKLYRRIWWALYSLDIFHVSVNTRRSRLLEDTNLIKPRTEDDWDTEIVSEASSSLLSPVTPQQRTLPVVQCELSQIFGRCLASIKNKPQQDPRLMLQPLDTWRKSLATKMFADGNTGSDVCYLSIKGLSYRFECILCRLIRRYWKQSQDEDYYEWAKQRLRSAIFELDTIAKTVLSEETLQMFPISFITTIIALVALHIESALDHTETQIVHSMARISISQAMLVLIQGKEIPALKRALPLFENILAKKNLYLVPPNTLSQAPTQSTLPDSNMLDISTSPNEQVSTVPSQFEYLESDPSLYVDFLGFDLLDEWQTGQMDLTHQF